MTSTVLHARDRGSIYVRNGVISEPFSQVTNEIDCTDLVLMPGFIDVHNHGAVGVDVNSADASELLRVAEFLATQGVTSWMPTLVPDSDENYCRAIAAIDELMELQVDKRVAQAVGVHYEGVFANKAMCGALRPEFFRGFEERTTPSAQSGGHPSFVRRGAGESEMQKTAREQGLDSGSTARRHSSGLPMLNTGVHMTTLAPEIDGGIELIERLVAGGWIVSIGHTTADVGTLDRAFDAGARHLTHFFNAMSGVHHRNVGVAGWGLAKHDVTFDIIADGIHVAPRMLAMACRAKSPERVSLISDSVAPTGLGDGEYELWGERVSVVDGRTQNERGSIAGSVCTMLDCVRTMQGLGFGDSEIELMASANPARLLGLTDRGSIEVGKRADLVAIDADANVAFTVIGGQVEPPA